VHSYLGVDEHFTQEDLTRCVLPLKHGHRTIRLSEALSEGLEEFGLQDKIKSVVTDDRSNMVALKRHIVDIECM